MRTFFSILTVLFLLFHLNCANHAAPPANQPSNDTATFLGSTAAWPQCRIILQDIHGLWGGTAVVLDGSGKCIIRTVKGAAEEKRYALNLSADEMTALRELLIAVDFTTVQAKDRKGVPDEARPTIILRNGEGKEHSTAKWANDKVDGFDKVYRALLDLKSKTRDLKPEYEGEYQRDWQPLSAEPAVSSKPVEKDGLQVTATLPKASFAAAEPLRFAVQFKNVSKIPFQLPNAEHYRDWRLLFKKQGQEKWREFGFDQAGQPKPATVHLAPGKILTVQIALDGMDLTGVARILADGYQEQLKMSDGKEHPLKPGKYLLAVKMDLRESVPADRDRSIMVWAGPITTEPVTFEIKEKNAATQP